MNFFFDENFPKSTGELLHSLGHHVIDIRGSNKEGLDDKSIFALCQEHKAIFLTTDRDFFHTIPHLFKHHEGVIIIALRQPNKHEIYNKLKWALDNLNICELTDQIIQLRDNHYSVIRK